MKALKSKRASELLADPDAREQLRLYLTNKPSAASGTHTNTPERFVVRRSNGVQFEVKLVPKASVTS